MRRVGLAVVVLLALLAHAPAASGSTGPGAAPRGSIGIQLIDVPVSAGDDPRARLYVVDHLAPGAVIDRRIRITNTSGSDVVIALYPAAASVARGVFLGAPGHTPNDLSTWTSVTPGVATVPAGGRLTAAVRIAVPHDAAPGERYGVVWAETRSARADDGVTEVNRVGVRIYASVGPGGPPAANFAIESLTAQRSAQGRPTVVAMVHNTGGRAVDLSGSLGLSSGPGGLSAGPFPASLGVTLGIGATEPVTVTLDSQLPAGPWNARVTLRSGLVERTGRATITFPPSGAAAAPVAVSTGWQWWLLIGLATTLLLGAAAVRVVSRQRHRARPGRRTVRKRPTLASASPARSKVSR